MNGTMWSRVQTTGPTSTDVRPASSASSRRTASSGVSPGSMPPPGVAQNVPSRELEADEQDPVVRVEHDGPRAGRIRSSPSEAVRDRGPATCERRAANAPGARHRRGGTMRGFIAALLVGVTIPGVGGGDDDAQARRRDRRDDRCARPTRSTADTTDATRHDRRRRTSTDTTSTDTTHDRHRDDGRRAHRRLSEGRRPLRPVRQGAERGRSERLDRLEKTAEGLRGVRAGGAGGDPGRLRDPGARPTRSTPWRSRGLHLEAGQVPDAATIAKLAKAA